jgi:Ca-activated chloride channel family protein
MIHRHLRKGFERRVAIAPRFAPLSKRSSGARDAAVLVAGVLAAAAIAAALVRPQAPITRLVPQYERADLIIMLDRSVSMRAHDVRPSRASRASLEIRNFLRQKPEGIERVALIGFADSAVVLTNLTTDLDSVLFYFDWLEKDPTTFFGTDIGAALTSAMDLARKDDRQTRKLFLIVSDGEDHGDGLTRAVALARSRGYRVDCIGIGSDQAVPIPVPAERGRETPLLDDTGRPVTTRFSEGTLRSIATATGGRFVRSFTGDELRPAIAAITEGERRFTGWQTSTDRRDIYLALLGIASFAGAALWVLQ